MTDENWIAKTIQPKSDQLNAEDLITGPITATITDVKRGDTDQPVAICIQGYQPYKPCKTMRRLLVALWGDKAHEWIGRRVRLFADPGVKWAGVAVGGIRISHLSDITEAHTLMLSVSRGKREAVTVLPLAAEVKAQPLPTMPKDLADSGKRWAKELGKDNPFVVSLRGVAGAKTQAELTACCEAYETLDKTTISPEMAADIAAMMDWKMQTVTA